MTRNTVYISCLLVFIVIIPSCSGSTSGNGKLHNTNSTIPTGLFMGIEPTENPVLLFPDFINTPMGEYNGTFNPEGTEFFYTVSNIWHNVIVSSRLQGDGSWSKPAKASFAVPYDEFDPLFSPDGQSLYFSSHRPFTEGGKKESSNIWRTSRTGDNSWSEPELINLYGPRKGNYFSSLTKSGNIYFNIWNTGNMFKAIPVDTGYIVESLGDIINSNSGDGDPFIAPDESYLIFRSRREGGLGVGDLWVTFNLENGWTEPQNLGDPINSKYHEMCPYVTADGKLFIFSSGRFDKTYFHEDIEDLDDVKAKLGTWDNGQQNIYTMSASFIDSLRAEAVQQSKLKKG